MRALPPDGGPEFNRLVFEKSPYLLQHASNPVDWYPWGEAAFERARREDKPIFLSIGYSTCHWCHVMEHESFENEEVAALLNRDFVCIKVDREERPDVDSVYMSVCQAMTGGGGWPLTVLLMPDKRPFFAATYIPREDQFGRKGILRFVPEIAEAWRTHRADIEGFARRATERAAASPKGESGSVNADVLIQAARQLAGRFDAQRGGFGDSPKFPTPHHLTFLLRAWKRSGDAAALHMVEKTLSEMASGGIYDHVGFGFHRYSTDADWLVPHFEKMLYDQAQLVIAYSEAFAATGKPEYARTAREIMTYVLRDMTAPEGGFYSAEDADSEGVEGKFYVWTRDELVSILGETDADFARQVWNVLPEGNFTNPHTPPNTNILHRTRSPAQLAEGMGISESDFLQRIEGVRQKLFAARVRRIAPYKDDKILTDWNGLMIAAAAVASRTLDQPEYADAARRAADFALDKLRDPRGRLLKRYRAGEAGLSAHLEDYAFLIWGLIELYETTFEARYLEEAVALQRMQLLHYWDPTGGGFFLTAGDGEALIARPREVYDGALPSGNSVSLTNLLRLSRMTGEPEFEKRASQLTQAFGGSIGRAPVAYTHFLCGVDFVEGPAHEVVIVGRPGADDTRAMLDALQKQFLPNVVVLLRPDQANPPPICRIAPFTLNQTASAGQATAYVCRNFSCNAPTTDPAKMLSLLGVSAE
ncbi:MAG: thioredoxin domain-containing protein [Phycisphaerales bacterium]|nr:thioredoxin domain-containing protein [Phycisphaerales bacterium]